MQRWSKSGFKFDNEAEVRTAFNLVVESREEALNNFLSDRLYTVPNSNERLALL